MVFTFKVSIVETARRKYLKTRVGVPAHIECVAQMPLLLIRLAEEPGSELEYLVIIGRKYNLKQ